MSLHVRKSLINNATSLLLLIFLISSGCEGTQSEKKFRIGFSQCTMYDDWRKTMVNEMNRELILYDDMEMIVKDAEGDNQKQIEQIQELVDQKIDLLIVSPNEADPITPVVEKVYGMGIPVIVVDRKINSSSYTAYVGADNRYIGATIGKYIGNQIKNKTNILEIWGLKGSTPFIERDRGFREVITTYPDIKVTSIEGDWGQKHDAEAAFRKLISAGDNFEIVFAHNDIMALAAYQVYQTLPDPKKPLKFVGVDGLAGPGGGMEGVANGVLKATALYPTGGDKAIEVASDILRRRSYERENMLKTVMIDSSNVFVMKAQAEKIRNQQRDILRQETKNNEQIQIYNSQRTLIYILLGSLVFLVVVSGIAILAWRDKIDINRKLEAKTQETGEHRDTIVEMARRAEVAIQEKLKFFTNISHEFKTPLTLIMGPADLLLNESSGLSEKSRKHALLIKKNASRLLRLINQLMDFRKIEERKMIIHASEEDIVQFISGIVVAFEDLAKNKRIQLNFSATEESIKACFDPDMLDKVLFNLLSNAFKFTGEKGKIEVSVSKDVEEKNLLIVVEDNGQGMSKESIQHAFDRFYSDGSGGTGLGLSLSREFMELHHGDIVLTSEKGVGTRFCIVLPLGNAHFEGSAMQKIPGANARNRDYDFLERDNLVSVLNDYQGVGEIKQETLLIIEDNKELRIFLKEQLTPYYNVEEASDAIQGLKSAFENVPDLVICDVMLPGKNGFEVTRTLKEDLRTSHIPVIILTAKGTIEQKIAGIKSGADDYVTKPFLFEFLIERIKSLIRTREVLKEHYSQDLPLAQPTVTPGGLDKKFINDFRALVEKNVDNPEFNVNEIGPELGMSRVQVYRKVKALLDCSVNEYIVNLRLKKAQYLLLNTEKTVAEIASEVGFSTPNYFSTSFKAKFNVTPKEFKQSQKRPN